MQHAWRSRAIQHTHTHTHTRLTALCPGLPRWAGTGKVKPIWILLKQEPVSGTGISWAVCKSATRSRQKTTPAPHHSVFLQAGCPSGRPTNSVKALKAPELYKYYKRNNIFVFRISSTLLGLYLETLCVHILVQRDFEAITIYIRTFDPTFL